MAHLTIRELTPGDQAAVAYELRHLGERSYYQRFFRGTSGAWELVALRTIDHWHHEGLIAFSCSPRVPVGVVEYLRLEAFDEAELAVSVVDGWQRRGVGRQLVRELRDRAVAAGIRRFHVTIMRGNHGAVALAREIGRATVVRAEGNAVDWLVEL
jgi:acetyltransferase